MKGSSIFRFLLWAGLLIGGFFIGSAWNTKHNLNTAPQTSADEAIDQGIEKVKLSSMRGRLRAVVDGVSLPHVAEDDDAELW